MIKFIIFSILLNWENISFLCRCLWGSIFVLRLIFLGLYGTKVRPKLETIKIWSKVHTKLKLVVDYIVEITYYP